MLSTAILGEAFGRVRALVHTVVEDASVGVLTYRPDAEANTIAWLVWHLTRVQDDHIADLVGEEQLWNSGGWAERFDLPFDPRATGYGQSADEVAGVRADAEILGLYYDAVHARTMDYLNTLDDEDFDTVVDPSWNPPVTLGVRLVSILADDLQHAGQASYVRGLAKRARPRMA